MISAVDRWGRYLIVPPEGGEPVAHTRATTWASTLDDRYAFEKWGRRSVALGLARRPDLLASVAAAKYDDRDTLDGLCERALEAGGSSTKATLGQALHKFAKRIDNGEDVDVPDPWRAVLDVCTEALLRAGITVDLVEQVCVCPVLTVEELPQSRAVVQVHPRSRVR